MPSLVNSSLSYLGLLLFYKYNQTPQVCNYTKKCGLLLTKIWRKLTGFWRRRIIGGMKRNGKPSWQKPKMGSLQEVWSPSSLRLLRDLVINAHSVIGQGNALAVSSLQIQISLFPNFSKNAILQLSGTPKWSKMVTIRHPMKSWNTSQPDLGNKAKVKNQTKMAQPSKIASKSSSQSSDFRTVFIAANAMKRTKMLKVVHSQQSKLNNFNYSDLLPCS